ncbi:MAG: gamma-glutamyltransferase, partial [Gammaproteobacteria bacterium]|nr:gamma-glutamyltransferase [Gammaproteobacteria bacterium]
MTSTATATRGMVVAPHHLAAQSGLAVLREGGNAVEAMVAAAAAIAVVYPHMNAIGGDGFWIVHTPGAVPIAIDACGAAAGQATPEWYRSQGCDTIPARGPLAANTVAGTVSGWEAALAIGRRWGGMHTLERLLADAVHYAEHGVPVTASQHSNTRHKRTELETVPGFAEQFLPRGATPAVGDRFANERLGRTFRRLAQDGLDSFYRGALADAIAADLARIGSPLSRDDLERHRAEIRTPLQLALRPGTAYNFPPPTQGLASLMILGIFERLGVTEAEGFAHLHGLVEASKQAFIVRDREIADPRSMRNRPEQFLAPASLDAAATAIDPACALEWPRPPSAGDTVWMGAIDGEGRAVSFIQSVYWEFGSGVVLEETGIQWQNRGSSFRLDGGALNRLAPGRKPFHTLNPALFVFEDGRTMPYGTMGGEGQPQTQAAVLTRYGYFGQGLQEAVSAPRWLLGRTWGEESTTLKLESR